MPLDMKAVLFGVAVATMAEALLGEATGDTTVGECPKTDPECRAGWAFGDHRLCQYPLAPCTDPTDGCPPAARALASEAR